MSKKTSAVIAMELCDCLGKFQDDLIDCGELERNRFADAMLLICAVTRRTLVNATVVELADYLSLFVERKSEKEIHDRVIFDGPSSN